MISSFILLAKWIEKKYTDIVRNTDIENDMKIRSGMLLPINIIKDNTNNIKTIDIAIENIIV